MGISLSPFICEQENWILWLPVCFAGGILVYFSLPAEPPLWPACFFTLCSLSLTLFTRKHPLVFALMLAVFFAGAGFLTISWRTLSLQSPVIAYETKILTIEGRVIEIFPLNSGKKMILDQLSIPKLAPDKTPKAVRLIIRTKSDNVQIGDRVSLRGALSPPPPPVLPGGYDFARMAYYKQIGAIGYSVTPLTVIASPATPSIRQRLYHFRMEMAEHIVSTMGTRTGTIVTAIMLGMDSAIDKTILAEMRASGISHILSVSGMHISMVAALFFFLTRLLFVVLCEPLAASYDIKKPAALVAILASFGYYLISGMQVAAFRSFLMTALVILALVLNRTPTPMRSVAWAALIILIVQPESITDPSFQMSFAAVTALFATYTISERCIEYMRRYGIPGAIFTYISGVAFSSLIAGLATAPFAMYHFNQYANYSILANVLAVPLTTFLVMPLAVLAFFLYPLGLDHPILWLMQWSIDAFIWIAHWAASLPKAVLMTPFMPTLSLLLIVLGGLWLCLWQAVRLRILGLVPIVLAFILMLLSPKPDMIIDGKGKLFAVRGEDGELMVSSRQHSRFARTMWLKQNGQTEALNFMKEIKEDTKSPITCDEHQCHYLAKGTLTLFALTANGLPTSCDNTLLLVNLAEEAPSCHVPYSITQTDLLTKGTHLVFLEKDRVRMETVADMRGDRLWSQ